MISLKTGICHLLFLLLSFYHANSQAVLKLYKDSTGKFGYKNQSDQIFIQPAFQDAASFINGMAAVKLLGKWGFINTAGKEVIPIKYQEAGNFSAD